MESVTFSLLRFLEILATSEALCDYQVNQKQKTLETAGRLAASVEGEMVTFMSKEQN